MFVVAIVSVFEPPPVSHSAPHQEEQCARGHPAGDLRSLASSRGRRVCCDGGAHCCGAASGGGLLRVTSHDAPPPPLPRNTSRPSWRRHMEGGAVLVCAPTPSRSLTSSSATATNVTSTQALPDGVLQSLRAVIWRRIRRAADGGCPASATGGAFVAPPTRPPTRLSDDELSRQLGVSQSADRNVIRVVEPKRARGVRVLRMRSLAVLAA